MKDLSNKNVIHVKKDGMEYLQFRKLLEYDDIINHAYTLGLDVGYKTTTADKKMASKERIDLANESYKKICNAIGENYVNILQANQTHTDIVKVVEGKINNDKPDFSLAKPEEEDALITKKKDIILSTTNADCILLLIFDPVKKVIANCHSGWKGTLQRISVKTIKKMMDEFDCNPKDIIVCMCPSIRKCHFEVDKEVKDMFENEFKDLEGMKYVDVDKKSSKDIEISDFIIKNEIVEKWNVDTVLINKVILQNLGLEPKNIIDSMICDVCNSDIMHSFRVEKENYMTETALICLRNN